MIEHIIVTLVIIWIYWGMGFWYYGPTFSICKKEKQWKTTIKFG